jgi:hypothetical protein
MKEVETMKKNQKDIYADMTNADFDRILIDLVNQEPASNLVQYIPGVYELVSEHFNNEILTIWENENPA